jgi:hypothetical protein
MPVPLRGRRASRFSQPVPRRTIARPAALHALAAGLLVVVMLAGASACTSGPALRVSDLHRGWTWQPQQGQLTLGVTHTQHSLNPQDPTAALRRATRILGSSTGLQDQALMGWGVLNPEPRPGHYDWRSLDQRMRLIKESGGEATLTLCGAPDWMKGGDPGTTDWSTIEKAPKPSHYRDFAKLAAAAVKRYPQVRRVMVWNEFKGFFDNKTNTWDAAAYTRMYNDVYDAVKKARPDVRVGGPYVPVDTWSAQSGAPRSKLSGAWGYVDRRGLTALEYWLDHKHGADFVVVDGYTETKDDGVTVDPAVAAAKFATITDWIHDRTSLPVWWSEFYATVASGGGPTEHRSAAATLEALAAFARSGVAAAFLWQPQGDPSFPYAALWTSTSTADGGRATPLTKPWQWLLPRLRAGGVTIGTGRMSADGHEVPVRLLAFRSKDRTLLVNTTDHLLALSTVHGSRKLAPWGTVTVSNESIT